MANYTPNLNLRKPLTTEKYDVVADLNDTKDKIDNHAGAVAGQINAVNAQLAENAKHKVGWINALENGAIKDDINFDTGAVINSLFETYDTVYVPNGTFHTTTTIVIPEEKELIMDKATRFYVQANVDLIHVHSRGRLNGGYYHNGIGSAYTSSMISIKQDNYTRGATRGQQVKNVELRNESFTGTGIMLDASVTPISFAELKDFRIYGFKYGVNTIDNTWLTACIIKGVVEQATMAANLALGGSIVEISGQTGSYDEGVIGTTTVSGVGNTIISKVYDTGNTGETVHQIHFTNDSLSNKVVSHFGTIVDEGANNHVISVDQGMQLKRSGFQGGGASGYLLNTLSNAHKRLGYTIAYNNVINNSFSEAKEDDFVMYMTNPVAPYLFADLGLDNINMGGEVALTFDLRESITLTEVMAHFFSLNYSPDEVIIELSNDGTTWNKIVEKNTKDRTTTTGSIDQSNTTHIRYTFKMLPNNTRGIRLHGLFASGGVRHSNYLSTTRGIMYGDITFFENGMGTVHVSPNGTKFRLGVSDAGELTFTQV